MDSYLLSGGTELAGWHKKHQFQIQKLWCDQGLLQSSQYFCWSNGELESGPAVHSFLWLPGHQYWGSLRYTDRPDTYRSTAEVEICRIRPSFDLKLRRGRAPDWTDTISPQEQICLCSLPQCPDHFSQLCGIVSVHHCPDQCFVH